MFAKEKIKNAEFKCLGTGQEKKEHESRSLTLN
jgi:hypothetical protein